MLLSLVIILILILAVARGWRRGLVLELLYSLGYIAVFIFAKVFTNEFSVFLTSTFGGWTSDQATNLTVMHSVSFILLISIGFGDHLWTYICGAQH